MIELQGYGLFGGERAVVRLTRHDFEVQVRIGDVCVPLAACEPRAGLLSTELVCPGGQRVRGVEHWAAAAGGLSLHRGFVLELVEGDELPLLDGAAEEWTDALARLGIEPAPGRLQVARTETFEVDGSTYEFLPGKTPALQVELVTSHPRLEPTARWDGDRRTFVERIANARTFAFAADLAEYAARGATPHVRPEQVVVIDQELHAAGRAADPDEPARHKLLDLLGDLFTHGGPPRGTIRARAPGHGKTHQVVRRALASGVLVTSLVAPSLAAAQRFEPSPLTMPTLVHPKPTLSTDLRMGFFQGDGDRANGSGALLRHAYDFEVPVLPRRVYLGARYAFASGHSLIANDANQAPLAQQSELVSGNTQLSVRSLWVAPAGLALGGALDVTLPTAFYRPDSVGGDVAVAAQGMSPNDWMSFLPRTFGVRPTFDVRIRAAGFTFQLRQSLTLAVGVASGADSAMVAEFGLYVGQQIGPVQVGLELAELYFLDTLLSSGRNRPDSSRARFAFIPQVRMAHGRIRPGFGVMYSPSSAYDGASTLTLNFNVNFALF